MDILELTKHFEKKDEFQKSNIVMDGLREFHVHPEGGTTLIFERASSAHKVNQMRAASRSEKNDPQSKALARAANIFLRRKDQSWRNVPSIEEVHVQETPEQITCMLKKLDR